MIIPNSVKVGNFVYNVEVVDEPILLDFQVCSGVCDSHNQLIQLSSSLTKQNKERVFLHELFHAMAMDKEFDFGDDTEYIIDNFAKSLHGVIIDNPMLFIDEEVIDELLDEIDEEVEYEVR